MAYSKVALAFVTLGLVACASNDARDMEMPPPATLFFSEPVDGQVGLKYGETQLLRVRLGRVGAAFVPVEGEEVRFSIFGDPKGSTLALDRALTDPDGIATVPIAAGQQEATFVVSAQSSIAETIEFFVSVSKNELLDLDVVLAIPASLPAVTARALLYMDRGCSSLHAQPEPEPALRMLSASATAETLIPFRNLLAQSYAIVGRADDAAGKLLAWRCIDLPVSVVPSGAQPRLVVPLLPVVATLGGTFALSFTLPSTDGEKARIAPWQALIKCALDPAESLLTALYEEVAKDDPALAATLSAKRAVASTGGCRPTSSAPDAALATALAGGPADQVRPLVADLAKIAGSAQLTTKLSLQPVAGATLSGSHQASSIRFETEDGFLVTLDLEATGWFAGSVPLAATRTGDTLVTSEHLLPLGLPFLWRVAWETNSVAVRLPDLTATDPASIVAAILAAPTEGASVGCAAIAVILTDDLLAQPVVAAACDRLPDRLGPQLAAAFSPVAVPTPRLTIQATLDDSDGDLQIDAMQPGTLVLSDGRMVSLTGSLVP